MDLTIPERLDEFYRRLRNAPTAKSADAAMEQMCRILEAVEDEHCGVPRSSPPPAPGVFDGRMYPPLDDHLIRTPEGDIVAKTRGHIIEISRTGTIRITSKVSGAVEFET